MKTRGFDGWASAPSWFVVLPDLEEAGPLAARLRQHADQEIAHASGRPWLIGRWPEADAAIAEAGATRIAVLGQHGLTPQELRGRAARIRAVGDLDPLVSALHGSMHVLASVGGQVRAQGTVTGIRRVFQARIGDAPVAADRADVLAWLLGGGVDEARLALHLLEPHILYPVAGIPVWRGVSAVPNDHYLVLTTEGRTQVVPWWSPPEPVVPMAEGAVALREALAAALAVRVAGRPTVSCDLGGVDSTAICCTAASQGANLVAYTAGCRDPLADDERWAARTIAALPNVEHHVIAASEIPLRYHGVLDMDDPLDEPCTSAVDRERWLVIARQAAARGSTLHLTGFGGDELLYGSLAHLHTLLRSRPGVAMRNLRGFAVKYRWSRGEMLRQLRDRRPYRAWLETVADELTEPQPPLNLPLLEWGFRPRLPHWVTADAAAAVRDLVRSHARTTEPLSSYRGQHRELETMRFVSRLTRQFDQMAMRSGIGLGAPYFDDRVIEAGLQVRPEDRISPWRYKPLIKEAMRGIVPEASLERPTKATGSCDEGPGLQQNRGDLLALFEDSRLGRMGLVNPDVLREVCMRPLASGLGFSLLDQVVACEAWLRAVESERVVSGKE